MKDFFTNNELFNEGNYTKKQILAGRNNIKPVLYLISVVNLNDADIKRSCIADGRKVTSYFKRVAGFLEIPFTEKKYKEMLLLSMELKRLLKIYITAKMI